MNTYIILTDGIADIGGGQLYVNSKAEFMEKKGWNVFIFSKVEGEILVEGLKKYSKGILKELGVYPMHLPCRARENTLRIMAETCSGSENIIIESNSTTLSVWGELLAALVKGKNFIYNLNENPICERALYPFFLFKYNRKEFTTIKKEVVMDFFEPYLAVKDAESRVLDAVYSVKQVDDVPFHDINELNEERRNICVIGRLDKPFVKSVINDLKRYCLDRPNEKYNIVVIGGDQKGMNVSGEIKEIMEGMHNVNLFMMGYMFPMPRKLLKCMNVCISTAGAVRSIGREKILTISIDGNDLKPIGLWGLTTTNTLFRDTIKEPAIELGMLLDDIFNGKYNSPDWVEILKEQEPLKIDYLQKHLDYINKTDPQKEYYTNFKIISYPKKILLSLIGLENYEKLWKKFH